VRGDSGLPGGRERARMVREMFDRISGRYELLNAVMTAGLYRLWNRRAVDLTWLGPGGRVIDLACGTGSLTRELARRVGPGGYVLGVDFSENMLAAARERPVGQIEYRLGDATRLEGVPSGGFDAATIAYGARNIPDLEALFAEMARVVRNGGRVVCLEIAEPEDPLFARFYGIWFDKIVPRLGAVISGDARAYSYLPESVKEFVSPEGLAAIMRRNGLQSVRWERLAGGIITLHHATKRA
jgi:demethylmenaquinone methyltransferase/2-methoxy-6-polyprenyl-1,4-benzoquinol methylase